MINCLRESFLYSEKRPRDMLFQAIDKALADNVEGVVPLTLVRLTRTIADRVCSDAEQSGFVFSNWHTASRALINAMLNAGVLLTYNDAVIPAGVGAQAVQIVELKDGYRDLTEAYLIEFLIRKLGDVSIRDHKSLAHALFRQFDPAVSMADLEDRVVLLIAGLAERIVLNSEGVYAIKVKDLAATVTPVTPPVTPVTLVTQ